MTLVVGYAPDGRGGAVVDLAGMLARSAQEDLVVCAGPSPWPRQSTEVDDKYRRLLDGMAQAARPASQYFHGGVFSAHY